MKIIFSYESIKPIIRLSDNYKIKQKHILLIGARIFINFKKKLLCSLNQYIFLKLHQYM